MEYKYGAKFLKNQVKRLSQSAITSWSEESSEEYGKGAVLFTGPDGIRDHRVHVEDEHRYVGDDTMSPEGTSEVTYLWRAPPGMFTARPKSAKVGEIGWGLDTFTDRKPPLTGKQIALGEFRQAVEDRHTHLYQNAWYPGPEEDFPESSDAGQVMNVYRPQSQGRPRTAHSGGSGRTYGYNQATRSNRPYSQHRTDDPRRPSSASLQSNRSDYNQRSSLPNY